MCVREREKCWRGSSEEETDVDERECVWTEEGETRKNENVTRASHFEMGST